MLPNVVIGGAQKSGTTSLHYLLARHSDVFVPARPQEIHFFDLDKNYVKGVEWFTAHFASWQGEKILAQTSPLYLYEPVVPARLVALLPQVKLIFILRNPVDRAYSHYWHEVRFGYEHLSFEKALVEEESRIQKSFEYRRHFSYVDRGRYASQIARFLKLFPRDNILLLLYDDLKDNSQKIIDQCSAFLGIDSQGFGWDCKPLRVYNRSKIPRNAYLQRLNRRLRQVLPRCSRVVDLLNLREARYPCMQEPTRLSLSQAFQAEILMLQELMHINVQQWLVQNSKQESAL